MTTTEKIKSKALALGFNRVGIAKAARLDAEAVRLETWLSKNFHGEMTFMAKHFEMRVNPAELLPGAKSIVSVIANYEPAAESAVALSENPNGLDGNPDGLGGNPDGLGGNPNGLGGNPNGKLSAYAQRRDYHLVLKEKLRELFESVALLVGEVNGRAFVDSAPMLDKAWAERAGLGWIGKHTNLLNRSDGSYFFIGSLVLDCALDYDAPYAENYCGSCTACIDLCPTQAIVAPYQVDARKCISYLTIELKRSFTEEESKLLGNWLFGCDVCQDVCPWNRFAKAVPMAGLEPNDTLGSITEDDVLELTSSAFKRVFAETPVLRTGLRRLKRNAEAVRRNRQP